MDSGERIPVGYVRRAHGVRGAVIVRPLTDRPSDRFILEAIFLTDEDPPRSLQISSAAEHADGLLVSFRGIDERDGADALRGVSLTIGLADRRSLEDDEFWPDQLLGCTVATPDARAVGRVVAVVPGGAQDRLIVEAASGEQVDVPFVAELVPSVDIERRHIVVDPPEELLP